MKKTTIGALQVVLATAFWSFSGVFTKFIPWSGMTVFGMRALFAVLFLLPSRLANGVRFTKANFLGAVGVCATSVLFINAIKLTSAANAIVLQYAMPIIIIGLNWLILRQKPSKLHVVTAIVILFGVVLCSMGGEEEGHLLGDVLALASAVTWALVFFSSQLPGANSSEYTFLGNMLSAPFAVWACFDTAVVWNPVHWACIVGMGFCLAAGYFFITRGLSNTTPVSAALLSNLEPILNPLWVFIFLGQVPTVFSIIGAVVVITAATVYSVVESKA